MNKKLVTFMAVVCSATSNLALAIVRNYDKYQICHANNIIISPGASYLYSLNTLNEPSFISRDCLVQGGELNTCDTLHPLPNSGFVEGSTISPDDKYIYYFTTVMDKHYRTDDKGNKTEHYYGTVTKYAHFERIDLRADSNPEKAIYSDLIQIPMQLPTTLYSYLTVYPNVARGMPDSRYMSKLEDIFNFAYKIHEPLFQIPQRDIWGVVADRASLIIKADKNYNVSIYYDQGNAKSMGPYGAIFARPLSSLMGNIDAPSMKYDDNNLYADVSGSILSFSSGKAWRNITKNEPRVEFINGDEEGRYYGYSTYSSIKYTGSSQKIRDEIQLYTKYTANLPITGVSINELKGVLSVTVKPAIPTADKFQDIANNHFIFDGGPVVKIACGYEKNFTFQQKNIGGSEGLWVDSYIQNADYPTIIYVHGGPQENIDVDEPTNMFDFRLFFNHGFNVDVVHYGGSRFTFAQSGALRDRGRESLTSDARILGSYISSNANKSKINIRFDSFGAEIYRYMDKKILSSLHSVVLDVPMGSYVQNDSVLNEPSYRNIYGDQLYNSGFDRIDFDNTKSCDLTKNTLLVMGKKDTNVNDVYDYRKCPGNTGASIYTDNAGHGNLHDIDAVDLREQAILKVEMGNN